jgi:hypothetical protein
VFFKAPSMKLYIDYVNRYETALQTIQKLRESSDVFSHFLDENQQDPDSQRRNIQDFLIMPIQRIPRYVLLLGVRISSLQRHVSFALCHTHNKIFSLLVCRNC